MPSLRLSRLIRRDPDRPTLKQRAAALRATAAKVMRRRPDPSSVPRAAPADDPVHAAIAAHQAAYAEMDRLCAIWGEIPGNLPEYEEARIPAGDASREEAAAFGALLATRATTVSGLRALIEYLPKATRQASVEGGNNDEQRALDAIRSSLRGLEEGSRIVTGAGSFVAGASDQFGGLPDPAVVTAGFDVGVLPLREMSLLHDAARTIVDVGQAVLCQPRCGAERDGYVLTRNAAGQLVEWVVEVSRAVLERARVEARERWPDDERDAEERLTILAHATVCNGDPAEMRAFARDLQTQAGRLARG